MELLISDLVQRRVAKGKFKTRICWFVVHLANVFVTPQLQYKVVSVVTCEEYKLWLIENAREIWKMTESN